MLGTLSMPTLVVIVLVAMFLVSAIKILSEYERAVSSASVESGMPRGRA